MWESIFIISMLYQFVLRGKHLVVLYLEINTTKE